MKPLFKYGLVAIIIVILGTLFYNKIYIPKTTYETLHPSKGSLSTSVRGIGNVSAEYIYSITAQSGGKILNILHNEGSWVKKGEILVIMDGVDLPDQLDIAKATLQKAKYDLIASQNELKNQESQKTLILKTYNRYEKLNKQGYAAQSEYDKALADKGSIDSSILVSKSHINAAKAQIVLAQKSINAITTKLGNLEVKAPVDGYLISKTAQVAQNVLPTTTILQLVDAKTLWVQTRVDERVSGEIKVGQKAFIVLNSEPNKKYEGVVKRIQPLSDAVTLEREIDVAFVKIPEPFYINEQAEVSIITKNYKDVVKVSLDVVVQENGKIGVWVVKDMQADFRILQNRAQSEDEITASNLEENEQILVPNSHKKSLVQGMKIHL